MNSQTMNRTGVVQQLFGAIAALAIGLSPFPARSAGWGHGGHDGASAGMVKDAVASVTDFRRADPSLSRFFEGAVGYAVFPSVGKGGAGVGGAYGRGVVFERGEAIGRTTLTQVTVGAQLGGQAYSELVFFETPEALAAFKKGQLAMAAQVSAVIASSGASVDARYARGVAVFTLARAGLMAEVSVGGQKFGFKPFSRQAARAATNREGG
jgi:lipid-binding SYLF domain-containing protein